MRTSRATRRRCGIAFFSTPFEEAAVDVLEEVGVPAYKIASYEVNHLPADRARRPHRQADCCISTGMASLGDIERALDTAAAAGARDLHGHALRGQLPAAVCGSQPPGDHHAAQRVPDPGRLVRPHPGSHRRCRGGDPRRVRGGEALHPEPRPGGSGSSLRAGTGGARGDGRRDPRGGGRTRVRA